MEDPASLGRALRDEAGLLRRRRRRHRRTSIRRGVSAQATEASVAHRRDAPRRRRQRARSGIRTPKESGVRARMSSQHCERAPCYAGHQAEQPTGHRIEATAIAPGIATRMGRDAMAAWSRGATRSTNGIGLFAARYSPIPRRASARRRRRLSDLVAEDISEQSRATFILQSSLDPTGQYSRAS